VEYYLAIYKKYYNYEVILPCEMQSWAMDTGQNENLMEHV
jgi:hypothetical protein